VGVLDEIRRDAMMTEHVSILLNSSSEHARVVVDEQADMVFMDTLADLIKSGRAVLHASDEMVGSVWSEREAKPRELHNVIGFLRNNDEFVYLYPRLAVAEMQRVLRDAGQTLGFTVKAIGKQLAEEGYLETGQDNRSTQVVRHDGKIHRVWKLHKEHLGLIESEVDDEIPF